MKKKRLSSNGDWKCSRCKKRGLRVGVSLFLEIPAVLQHRLSKTNLRRDDVHVMGAGWDRAYYYCACGFNTHLNALESERKTNAQLWRFLNERGLQNEALEAIRAVCVTPPSRGT